MTFELVRQYAGRVFCSFFVGFADAMRAVKRLNA